MTAAHESNDWESRQGWIPYEDRDEQQRMASDAFHDQLDGFYDVVTALDTPRRAIIDEACIALTGDAPMRVWQSTGSCVGAAGAQAYYWSSIGDVFHRGDRERIEICFPYYTYGYGRYIGGMRSRGSGSYGASQAKAIHEVGMLPQNDPRVPRAEKRSEYWLKWSSNDELEWSYSPRWPVPLDDLRDDGLKHRVETVVRVKTTAQMRQLLAQGYGLTIASNFGTRPRIKGDPAVLLGDWNASWSHQMSISGYMLHDGLGDGQGTYLYLFSNQWGPSAAPVCPFLREIHPGLRGGFWVAEKTMQRVLLKGVCYGHSNTRGFPARVIDWGSVGLG